jgi:hypothetical protein
VWGAGCSGGLQADVWALLCLKTADCWAAPPLHPHMVSPLLRLPLEGLLLPPHQPLHCCWCPARRCSAAAACQGHQGPAGWCLPCTHPPLAPQGHPVRLLARQAYHPPPPPPLLLLLL